MGCVTSCFLHQVTLNDFLSPFFLLDAGKSAERGICYFVVTGLSFLLFILTFPLTIFFCLKILTRDSVTVAVDAVVYFRIHNATMSITNVVDANRSTRLLAQTTLRNVLGTKSLSEILSERDNISFIMQASLDDATEPWGVKVERVEVKDVRLPQQLQRAMAAEAEATREARAKDKERKADQIKN
ncbi:hypothetical protein QZH41_018930 [Actinostola sp. cb2023]|nr:hypothetical protein QZH41_018930 [Actinostola sp. cb2023]